VDVGDAHDVLVANLAVKHRAKTALRALLKAGMDATPALRRGLRHPAPEVRVGCCIVLDHFMDDEAVPELMANLDHPDARVRSWALHALACDRCKEGACRPGEEDVVPIAIRMLFDDPSPAVRTQAAHMLIPAVHRRDDARDALVRARDADPVPLVRKVAGWGAPGGPLYRKLAPRPARKSREQVQAERAAKRAMAEAAVGVPAVSLP
jgi:hypothetical protein